jgi:hypothetical protein
MELSRLVDPEAMEISRLLGLEGRWKLTGGVSHRKAIKKDCAPVGARENDRHAIDTGHPLSLLRALQTWCVM